MSTRLPQGLILALACLGAGLARPEGAPAAEELTDLQRSRMRNQCVHRSLKESDDLHFARLYCDCFARAVQESWTPAETTEYDRLEGREPAELPQLTTIEDRLGECDRDARAAAAVQAEVAETSTLTVPVPRGYFQTDGVPTPDFASQMLLDQGGLMLAEKRWLAAGRPALGAIFVQPADVAGTPIADRVACAAKAHMVPGEVSTTDFRTGANARVCEIDYADPDYPFIAHTLAIVSTPRGTTGVTCNYDPRRENAKAACRTVIDGVRLKAGASPSRR